MRNTLIIIFILVFKTSYAQYSAEEQSKLDSLNTILANPESHDTSIVNIYLALSEILYSSNPDTVIPLCEKSLLIARKALKNKPSEEISNALKKSIALNYNNIGFINKKKGEKEKAISFYTKSLEMQKELNDKKEIANCLTNIGTFYYQQGNMDTTISIYLEALKYLEESDEKKGLAIILNNIGSVYKRQGGIVTALKYYHRSLKIKEEIGDLSGIATSLNNLGNIYKRQGDFKKALQYYLKSLSIREQEGGKDQDGLAAILSNIGTFYQSQNEIEKGLIYLNRSLDIRKEINDMEGVAACMSNIGMIYRIQGKIEEAEKITIESLIIREQMGDKQGTASSMSNLAEIYFDQKKYKKAKQYSLKSMELAKNLGFPENIKDAAKILVYIYEHEGKGIKALEMHRLYISMRDSISTKENLKAAANQQAKYTYDNQRVIDEAQHEKQLALEHLENEKLVAIEHAENEGQRVVIFIIAIGLLIVISFLIFIFNRLRITRKQKVIIEKQKNMVDETNEELNQTNEELSAQRDEIENQKIKVEVAHQEIKDSIIYAKRIQEAILPSMDSMNKYLKDGFVLYQPKDVVAGDFYWQETYKGKVYVAAADCTGHGVPGAMVSVVCSNALSKVLLEDGITDAGNILDKTRDIVINKLAKSSDVKDGMDISLACFDFDNMKLGWAGANIPLYLLRNGEIQITKGNREPIGYAKELNSYTSHTFDLQKGDCIYLFTDGYADQFGGEKGKKLGYKNFRNKMLELSTKDMKKQNSELESYFKHWQGSEEQVDDVCVMGIRV